MRILTEATFKNTSTPSAIPTRPTTSGFCSSISNTSLAYCLLLSYSFFCIRFNSQLISVVSCAMVSAMGGKKDRRFSKTPRMWNTP